MSLIVARHRRGRTAHLFDIGKQGDGASRKALCGFACTATELEPLPRLSGALPCELCIRDLPDDLLASPLESGSEGVPADDPNSRQAYAVGLRGEFGWHRVPKRPVITQYEGRDVVVTECGRIGFLVHGTPPERYEPCPDCPT